MQQEARIAGVPVSIRVRESLVLEDPRAVNSGSAAREPGVDSACSPVDFLLLSARHRVPRRQRRGSPTFLETEQERQAE